MRAGGLLAFGFAGMVAVAPWPGFASSGMPGRTWTAEEARAVSLRVARASVSYRWDAPLEKAAADPGERRTRVGSVRAAPKDFGPLSWQAVEGGHVARFDVASLGAKGLRARFDRSATGDLEVRVRDSGGRVESMAVPAGAHEFWGPWSGGEVQEVEVFSARLPEPQALRLGAVVHFDRSLDEKAAGSCTIDTPCTTGNAALDAAIAERKKAVARITYVDSGKAFVCTGTLLDTEKFPAPYFLTANHCVGRAQVAASIASFWFYEATGCGSGVTNPGFRQVSGGMTIDFADPNTDQTLLLMNAAPPSGAAFSGWDAAPLSIGASVVSISHPAGDVSKWALATVSSTARFRDWEQSAWLTTFSRGIIEGGSSGSGLFELSGGSLRLRAVLSASTTNAEGGLSCTNLGQRGVYNRFDVFIPQVARRLMANPPPVADDHGNGPAEATPVSVGAAETTMAGRIDYAGDVDVFRLSVGQPGTLVVRSSGGTDTVGVLLDADGERLTSNDDAQTSVLDFGITHRVSPGTYHLAVSRFESAGTGPYSLSFALAGVTDNYTDLWWNPEESGWGINVNHQGNKIFATLFTYEAGGSPLWLVMSDGALQPDGTYEGALYRASGPPFNASPWGAVSVTEVGRMRLSFPGENRAILTYSVNGVTVSKTIERQRFSPKATTCAWSVFDRSYAVNFQDLWWNPAQSGWGINFAHQGDSLFATLFTYAADGRGVWYVMSNGARAAGTATYSGTLFRTTGPAFDTLPWTPATATPVGAMSIAFRNGNAATLTYDVGGISVTKAIERQVFASPATECFGED